MNHVTANQARTGHGLRWLAAAVLAALILAGCGQAGAGSGSGVSSTSGPGSSAPASSAPAATAADSLAGFFAAAARVDARLHVAAGLINGGIGATGVHFDQATVDAVRAADPGASAAAIPAGLSPELLRAVILVQSDLSSRWWAFAPVLQPSHDPPAQRRDRVLTCLGNGAAAAHRFDADLAAARSLAAASPPVSIVPPRSHAAAEVAIRLALVDEANAGCDSCGGFVATSYPAIRWQRVVGPAGVWDGTIGGIQFRASFRPGAGWSVRLNAC